LLSSVEEYYAYRLEVTAASRPTAFYRPTALGVRMHQ